MKLFLYCITGQDDGEYGIWTGEIERHRRKRSRRRINQRATVPAAAKEQQQDDNGQYDTVPKIKLVYEGKRSKEFRVTRNLNGPSTKTIMAKIIPHIEMRTKVIYSFKSEIHRGAGEIVDYSKTLTLPPGISTSLEGIQAYIEECEQKWLDLDNEKLWSKAYLPADRTNEARGNYDGKVIFKHVQIKLVVSNEPLMTCGPLLDWLRDKHCIYSIDTFDDNLCVWRCLVLYKRNAYGEKYEVEKRNCEAS